MVVALGGNLQLDGRPPTDILGSALDRLSVEGLRLVRRSSWWRSQAWPDPAQPDYINGVAIVETGLEPEAVLSALHRIEAALGRIRHQQNASRTLDLDLIAHGRLRIETKALTLPHPRAADRLFVMGPLAEIAPDWRHPVSGATARELARSASIGRDARPL